MRIYLKIGIIFLAMLIFISLVTIGCSTGNPGNSGGNTTSSPSPTASPTVPTPSPSQTITPTSTPTSTPTIIPSPTPSASPTIEPPIPGPNPVPSPTCTGSPNPTPHWQYVGQPGFAEYKSYPLGIQFINHIPYVLYYEHLGTDNRLLKISKYHNGNWEYTIIPDAFPSGSGSPRLISDGNSLYFANERYGDDNGTIYVYQYHNDQLTILPSPGHYLNLIGTECSGINMFVRNNKLYALFEPYYSNTTDSFTTLHEYSNQNWTNHSILFNQYGTMGKDMYVDQNNDIYVAAMHENLFGKKLVVMKYTSTWDYVGNPGFAETSPNSFFIVVDNHTPYVAFTESSLSNKANVMRYINGQWEYLGKDEISEGSAYPHIYIDNGIIYVAYVDNIRDEINGTWTSNLCAKKFINNQWVLIGPSNIADRDGDIGFYVKDGVPYIVFSDNDHGNKLSVIKYE